MKEKLTEIIAKYNSDETARISLVDDTFNDNGDNASFLIHGGLNGCGEWNNYFKTLSELTAELKQTFSDVWVITLTNDCPDDVFYCSFGIRE